MAKLIEEILVIKVSELVKDNVDAVHTIDDDMIQSLEAVIQELAGGNKLVEIVKE